MGNTDPAEIVKNDDGSLTVVTTDGDRVECDAIMYAAGRKGKVDSLGLDAAGVETKGTFIPVDDYSRTNVPSVYAVGDITDRMARPCDHEYIASTVFTTPEIGTVGYTEEDAAAKVGDIDVYRSRFRAMKHSFPKSETYSLFKIIVDSKTQRVVGCHLATDGAGEVMQGIGIAVKMGATKQDFDNTIGIHPTSAEELVTMREPSYYYRSGKKMDKL